VNKQQTMNKHVSAEFKGGSKKMKSVKKVYVKHTSGRFQD